MKLFLTLCPLVISEFVIVTPTHSFHWKISVAAKSHHTQKTAAKALKGHELYEIRT